MLRAYESGAVIAGSSAGAMVMCQYYYDPGKGNVVEGLNLLPNTCVLPHHGTFGKNWASRLSNLLPEAVLPRLDEQTGMLDKRPKSRKVAGRIFGKGVLTFYLHGAPI